MTIPRTSSASTSSAVCRHVGHVACSATKLPPLTGVAGLPYGGVTQLGKQPCNGVVLAFAGSRCPLLGLLIEKTIGFRITNDHEVGGRRPAAHGETAYELHATAAGPAGMARSPI